LDEPRATFGTVAGFFNLQNHTNRVIWPPNLERGGESVISGIPDWTGLIVTTELGESYQPGVDASRIEEYVQSMSLRNGMVRTNVSWVPDRGDTTFQLNFTVFAHQKDVNLGVVRLDIMASKDINVTITDVLDGAGATRATFRSKSSDPHQDLIWTSVSPNGQQSIVAFEYSTVQLQPSNKASRGDCKNNLGSSTSLSWTTKNASTIAQSWCLQLQRGIHSTVYKYVGIAATDAFEDATQSTARQEALKAKESTWEDLVQSHNNAWDNLWESADIIIPADKDIQKVTRASLFHLLANLRPAGEGPGIGDNSISPSGLSSDSYAGYIFWDADTWVAPSLVALHPDRAASINSYRSKLHTQARDNTKRNEFREFSGALYPWTSGRFGNCTGNGKAKENVLDVQSHTF
jgi:trehalose/maltose hydrolase-like predicted phosphorylase